MLDTSTPFHHASADEQLEALKAVVRRLTRDVTPVKVLEAGCGEYPGPVGLEDAESYIVGIDVCPTSNWVETAGWARRSARTSRPISSRPQSSTWP